MKILVTGGAGFIGSNFVRYLLTNHDDQMSKIVILDKLTYAGSLENIIDILGDQRIDFIKGDICEFKTIADIIPNVDVIVNFAAETHVDNSIIDGKTFSNTNILGVSNILENLKNFRNIRFIQISTDEVYGSISSGNWDENFPISPNSPYSASKASADLLISAYSKTFQLDTITTRCSNNYGPFQHTEKVIPRFITNVLKGKKIQIYGDGSNVREWIHVQDHCRAIALALFRGKSNNVYNIPGNIELSNNELAHMILKFMNADSNLIEYIADRPGHDLRYSLNGSKAKQDLNFQPSIEFENGLKSTISWYIENSHIWSS